MLIMRMAQNRRFELLILEAADEAGVFFLVVDFLGAGVFFLVGDFSSSIFIAFEEDFSDFDLGLVLVFEAGARFISTSEALVSSSILLVSEVLAGLVSTSSFLGFEEDLSVLDLDLDLLLAAILFSSLFNERLFVTELIK